VVTEQPGGDVDGQAADVPLLRIVRSAASPAGQILEVNDTRMNAEEWEISYSIQRHASARS